MAFTVVILTGNCHSNNSFVEEFHCLDQLLHHLLQSTIFGSSFIQLSDIILIVSQPSYPNCLHWSISRGLNPSNVIITTDLPELYAKGNLLPNSPFHSMIARKGVLLLSSYLNFNKIDVLSSIIRFYEDMSNKQYDVLKLESFVEPDTNKSTVTTIPFLILKSASIAADILTRFYSGLTYTYHHLLMDSISEYLSTKNNDDVPHSLVSYQLPKDSVIYLNPQDETNNIRNWYSNIQAALSSSSSTTVEVTSSSPTTTVATDSSPFVTVEEICHARIGFMGNPSDGFGGKTLSFLMNNFSAKVTIKEIDSNDNSSGGSNNSSGGSITLIPHPVHDITRFTGLDSLYTHSHIHGYYGGLRLVQAACKMFVQRCALVGLVRQWHWHSVAGRSIEISYDTDIPRMVGLSGSSAIVTAALRALMKYYSVTLVDLQLTQAEFCQVVLDVEKVELGINAGLQDRVVQSYGGLVHMDFSCMKEVEIVDDEAVVEVEEGKGGEMVAAEKVNDIDVGRVIEKVKTIIKDEVDEIMKTFETSVVASPSSSSSSSSSVNSSHVTHTTPFTRHRSSGIKVGVYTSLDPKLLPPLYLAYNTIAGGDSGQVHSTVKERWARRDPVLLEGMAALGQLADAARDCLLSNTATANIIDNCDSSADSNSINNNSNSNSNNNQPKSSSSSSSSLSLLPSLMDQNFAWRRRMYGEDVVGEINIRAVNIANEHGMAAKFTGSGGAIVCMRRDQPVWLSEVQEEEVRHGFAAIHFNFIRVSVG